MTCRRIYLDHAASAPLLPVAWRAMQEAMALPGNPSSAHEEGRAAKDLLEAARTRAATSLGCRPREVVFTSSGTIGAQIALRGIAAARRGVSRRIVVSALEHPAVGDAANALEGEGYEVVRIRPADDGTVDAHSFLAAAGEDTAVAALMLANHETGMRMPVATVAKVLNQRGIPLVCDACLGPGRTDVRTAELAASVLVLSAHKFGGPRGTGLVYIARKTPMARPINGGPQEEGVHPGTENVAGAAGLAVALERAVAETEERSIRYRARLSSILGQLCDVEPWSRIGTDDTTLPGIATLELPGVEGEAAMINLDLEGVAVATGSACAMGAAEPSPSLLAMGFSKTRAAHTVRLSVGEAVTEDDAIRAGRSLASVIQRLRSLGRSRAT